MMATLRAESWEIDFCLSPLMSAAREWNQQPSYNHTAPSPSALTVWMSCSREEKSRRIISSSHSASTLPDHMDPLLNWKQPLPLGLLLSCLGVRPPLLFPLWKWCSVWLLCGFIWWHRSHKKMVKRREGGGPLTDSEMDATSDNLLFLWTTLRCWLSRLRPKGTTCSLVLFDWANHGTVGTCYFSRFVSL